MSENTETTATETPKKRGPKGEPSKLGRRRLRAEGRKKRVLKLRSDKEFAKTYFEGKSKRANDKKAAFRKKKSRKK